MEKEIYCPDCCKKLATITSNDNGISIEHEKGVRTTSPTSSMGLIVIPITCPGCNKTNIELVPLV